MAGWSKVAEGSALDCSRTYQIQKLQTNILCYDFESSSKSSTNVNEQDERRCVFDQILSYFLKELCEIDSLRPMPPMLGNGQTVDLFKLYFVVRKHGGYEKITKNRLWNSIAVEFGFESGLGSAVKLIYVKYLDALDRWLQRMVNVKNPKVGLGEENSADLAVDLELDIKEFLSESSDQKKKYRDYPNLDLEKSELNFSIDEVQSCIDSNGGNPNADDFIALDSSVAKEDDSSRKRKKECYSGMLNWVAGIAKDPCDPAIGSLPERSKWKSYGNEELWKKVLLVREKLVLKRNVSSIHSSAEHSNWQKTQRMHPAMYEDHSRSERSRCSKRILSIKTSTQLTSTELSSSGDSCDKLLDPVTGDSISGLWCFNHGRKKTPLGPHFQVEVPVWTGETQKSDSKWVGTPIWPLKRSEINKYLIERERIGKGRQDLCGCSEPNSTECIRFHIAEKRKKLIVELGSAFYQWKFDKMGEEAAVFWTKQEEKKFEFIAKSNPPDDPDKGFWDELIKCFRKRSRGDLVNYYFNVFLLRNKEYQNRSDSDSDDDKPVVESSGSVLCTPKKKLLKVG